MVLFCSTECLAVFRYDGHGSLCGQKWWLESDYCRVTSTQSLETDRQHRVSLSTLFTEGLTRFCWNHAEVLSETNSCQYFKLSIPWISYTSAHHLLYQLTNFKHELYYTILYYTILYYTTLYYTTLNYTTLYYTILYYFILHYTTIYYTTLYYTILHYTTLYYTTLHYTTLHYTILYYIVYYTILYYTILYYTTLYYTILHYTILYYILYYTILYYTILYYTTLHYTILYYSILLLYYTILHYTILYYTTHQSKCHLRKQDCGTRCILRSHYASPGMPFLRTW
jgi:hypothetical protein